MDNHLKDFVVLRRLMLWIRRYHFLYAVLMLLFNHLLGILLFRFIHDEKRYIFEVSFLCVYIVSILVGLVLTYKKHRTRGYQLKQQ